MCLLLVYTATVLVLQHNTVELLPPSFSRPKKNKTAIENLL